MNTSCTQKEMESMSSGNYWKYRELEGKAYINKLKNESARKRLHDCALCNHG